MSALRVASPEPRPEPADGGPRRTAAAVAARRLRSYAELTKPRVIVMVLFVTAVGFVLGAPGPIAALPLLWCLAGTAFLCGGAAAVNQYLESSRDALMERTRGRPLPEGRIVPSEALGVGLALGIGGTATLLASQGALCGVTGFVTFAGYAFVYTPMKRRSHLALYVGAIPGALPPLIGWAAAAGALPLGAWSVFAVLFVWQIPHFAAIGWLYRDQYRDAGFPVVAARDPTGAASMRLMFWSGVVLVAVSALPFLHDVAGAIYLVGAMALGAVFLAVIVAFARRRDALHARRILRVSLAYVPLIFLLLLGDRFA